MSHESTPLSNDRPEIDISHPYLVPRDKGTIEVWHVATDEKGMPVFDDDERVVLQAQHLEQTEDGIVRPAKAADPEALGERVQSYYAEQLGQSRPYAKPEDFERIGKAEKDDGQEALVKDALRESLEPITSIDTAVNAEIDRSRMIDRRIGEIADQWKHIAYGGRADSMQVEQMIAEVYQIRGMLNEGMGANEDLRRKVSALVDDLDETKRKTINHIQQNPDADENVPASVKRAMDEAEELASQVRNASHGDESISDELNRLTMNMDNLLQDQYGWETYMAQIKRTFDQFESDTSYTRGVPYMRADGCVDTLRRIRANVESWYE